MKNKVKHMSLVVGIYILSMALTNSYYQNEKLHTNYFGMIFNKIETLYATNVKVDINGDSGLKNDEQENIETSKKVSIYLNPSVQTWNLYTNNLGTEAEHMWKIATEMHRILSQYDFLEVEGNLLKNGLSLEKSIKESNSKKRDIHLSLHSNAGGGQGSEIYTISSNKFASSILDGFTSQTGFKSRGVKNGSHLYEVKSIKASEVALFEVLFHDNLKEANYIVNNYKDIAQNLSQSIVTYVLNQYLKK